MVDKLCTDSNNFDVPPLFYRITLHARATTLFTFRTPLDDTNKSDSVRLRALSSSVLSAAS
jgi:hypothetical protein